MMAMELVPGALGRGERMRRIIRYHPEFGA
jgi:hypothetical protein